MTIKTSSIPPLTFAARSYYLLTKPGIIMGNAITAVGGFALASKGHIDVWLFLATLAGLSLVIASACVLNNYIDRAADEKMSRTKNRPLVKGIITLQKAKIFALFLGVVGTVILALYTNLLAAAVALFGFFVYVLLYTFAKYFSVHGTLIGSIAGAVPPVVGYCAVSNSLDAGALLLFAMIALWQMPHFYAIAIFRLDDYTAASIPVLPLVKGMLATKVQMLLYIIVFMAVSSMLAVLNYVGLPYLIVAVSAGLLWLGLCIKGFRSTNEKLWARQMFFFSLVVIMAISIAIPFTVLS